MISMLCCLAFLQPSIRSLFFPWLNFAVEAQPKLPNDLLFFRELHGTFKPYSIKWVTGCEDVGPGSDPVKVRLYLFKQSPKIVLAALRKHLCNSSGWYVSTDKDSVTFSKVSSEETVIFNSGSADALAPTYRSACYVSLVLMEPVVDEDKHFLASNIAGGLQLQLRSSESRPHCLLLHLSLKNTTRKSINVNELVMTRKQLQTRFVDDHHKLVRFRAERQAGAHSDFLLAFPGGALEYFTASFKLKGPERPVFFTLHTGYRKVQAHTKIWHGDLFLSGKLKSGSGH